MSKLIQPVFAPLAARLPSQTFRNSSKVFGLLDDTVILFLRDQFSLSTWLCVGAIVQGSLLLALGRLALIPAVLLLLTRITIVYLQTVGAMDNPYMSDVVSGRTCAQVPDSDGTFRSTSSSDMVIFLIGARSNHPLGAFAPNVKEIGDYFVSLRVEVEARASEYGFLGGSSWLSTERAGGNEPMNIMYFSSVAGLHKFAHDLAHRDAWNWYREMGKNGGMKHVSIWHEMFESKRGGWESVYVNSHPIGLGATTFERNIDGETKYVGSLVEARGAAFGSAKSRLGAAQTGTDEN